jgi:hypothetical protein
MENTPNGPGNDKDGKFLKNVGTHLTEGEEASNIKMDTSKLNDLNKLDKDEPKYLIIHLK